MKKKSLGRVNLSNPLKPRIDLVSKKGFEEDLRLFKDRKRVYLIVETYYPKRSIAQNNLLIELEEYVKGKTLTKSEQASLFDIQEKEEA